MCSLISSWGSVTDIKYTPCLTWPRCGYPAHLCPLKHPQVDKLTLQHRTQQAFNPTTTTVLPQPRESIFPRAEAYSNTRLPLQLLLPPVMPSVLAAEGYVVPHDEAYASAKRHHRSTPPSPETLSPAPVGPALSICRPSESVPQNQATARCGLDMGAYQGRARSMILRCRSSMRTGAVLRVHVKVRRDMEGQGMWSPSEAG
jgi:hypothetical protein